MLAIDAGLRETLLCWAAALVLLTLTAAPASAQVEKPLTIEGQLKASDPLDRERKQSHHKVHELKLKKDQLYLIELRSLDFDPFLRLEDVRGKKLAENDDISKEDLNSRLGFAPSATATYRLVVTSYAGKQAGNYVLQVVPLRPAGEAKTLAGKLTKDSPRVQGRHAQIHKMKVEAGRWYVIDLVSKDFDPYLVLRDGKGKVLAQDNDSGGELNARLLWHSGRVGAWQVQVMAFRPGASGAYVLKLRSYEGARADPTERKRLARKARALNLRAVNLYQKGKVRQAVVLFQQAVALYEKAFPQQDNPELAMSLNNLGVVLQALGQAGKALPYYERALALRERLYPKQNHPDLATSLSNLGGVLSALGQAGKALPYCERALAMFERLYPKKDHPHLARSLNNLGGALQALGQAGKALPYYERALAMFERLYPTQDTPDLAMSLKNLGFVLRALGQAGKALPYCERALAMFERLYPKKDHPHLATSLNNLGGVLQVLGQAGKALPYFERALAMNERLYRKQDNPELATSLNNLGGVLRALGQAGKALPYFERALIMFERLYPKQDHPDLATSLNNLGGVLQALGQAGKALPCYERALAMTERLYRQQDHPDLATSLNNLGFMLHALGQVDKALPYYERALAMYQRLYRQQDHPHLAMSLNNLGFLLQALGEAGKALPYCERALAMYERLYPNKDHPHLATSLDNLGFLMQALGEGDKALPYYERALIMYRNLAEQDFVAESQALGRLAQQPRSRDAYLSLSRDRTPPPRAYAHLWTSKAAVTRILQDRHAAARLARSKSPQDRAAWEELLLVRGQLTYWLHNPGKDRAQRDREVRTLNERKAELERRLAGALPQLPRRKQLDRLGAAGLLARLPADTGFIDLMRYQHYEKGRRTGSRYAAFIVSGRDTIQRVELEGAAKIDLAVDLWRQALAGWSPSLKPDLQRQLQDRADKHAAELRRLVWEPLAKHLPKGIRTVYLAPDGKLARFAFATLPGRESGTILLQELTLAYVPHGPALLERLVYPPQFSREPGAALLVGGVRYDPLNSKGGAPWQQLSATTREIGDLKALCKDRPVLSLSGLEASTARLKDELPKARYAHLATHGFFKEDEFSAERKRLREQLKHWSLPLGSEGTELAGLGVQSPLVYTGLVLAGANVPDTAGLGGGVLSGEVIVELPLEGMRLAVLSACETGLGKLTGGEGVQGLVRAFHLAGCPDVVASLWQVNDRATAVLMAKFYQELWTRKRPPVEALRQAQLFVYLRPDLVAELAGDDRGPPQVHETRRREILERGVTASRAKGAAAARRAPTKLWAAFVLSGTGQ